MDDKLIEFCKSVKSGFGSITDTNVKSEFQRLNEKILSIEQLGKLLALLEKHELLDKKHSVNTQKDFYQIMYTKMTINDTRI